MKKTLKLPKKGGRSSTPVTFNNHNMPKNQMKSFMDEWSLTQAELNHVETIEEANDFEIYDEEDNDFFKNQTVYEMHDQAEENLALFQPIEEPPNDQESQAESNETVVSGEEKTQPPHDQSAPNEPNPPAPQIPV